MYAAAAGQNFWGARLNLEFPNLPRKARPTPGQRIMLATSRDDNVVQRANQALMSYGVHVEVFDKTRIQRGNDGFDVYMTKVAPGAAEEPGLAQANKD